MAAACALELRLQAHGNGCGIPLKAEYFGDAHGTAIRFQRTILRKQAHANGSLREMCHRTASKTATAEIRMGNDTNMSNRAGPIFIAGHGTSSPLAKLPEAGRSPETPPCSQSLSPHAACNALSAAVSAGPSSRTGCSRGWETCVACPR